MTKRTVTQLFTVVALATSAPMALADSTQPTSARQASQPRTLPSGAPACGNVMTKGGTRRRCEATAPRTEPARPAPTSVVQARSTLQKILTFIGGGTTAPVARPRQLRNGSPANGNVQGRMAPGVERRPVELPTGPRTQN